MLLTVILVLRRVASKTIVILDRLPLGDKLLKPYKLYHTVLQFSSYEMYLAVFAVFPTLCIFGAHKIYNLLGNESNI